MTVSPPSVVESVAVREVVEEFLAGYWSARTRANYTFILNGWLSWCTTHRHDPTSDVDPRALEAWIRQLQAHGYAAHRRPSLGGVSLLPLVRAPTALPPQPVEVIRRPYQQSAQTGDTPVIQVRCWPLSTLVSLAYPVAGHGGRLMAPREDVIDSPTGWVADHIRTYVDTDGRKGHKRWGVYTLLFTTRGRKSGKLRRTALIYGRDGDRYLVVASNGGAARHPAWYLNVLAHPEVEVQVAADTFYAIARPASEHEKPGLWRTMADLWPQYDRYQAKTRRDIPVVIIERTD